MYIYFYNIYIYNIKFTKKDPEVLKIGIHSSNEDERRCFTGDRFSERESSATFFFDVPFARDGTRGTAPGEKRNEREDTTLMIRSQRDQTTSIAKLSTIWIAYLDLWSWIQWLWIGPATLRENLRPLCTRLDFALQRLDLLTTNLSQWNEGTTTRRAIERDGTRFVERNFDRERQRSEKPRKRRMRNKESEDV